MANKIVNNKLDPSIRTAKTTVISQSAIASSTTINTKADPQLNVKQPYIIPPAVTNTTVTKPPEPVVSNSVTMTRLINSIVQNYISTYHGLVGDAYHANIADVANSVAYTNVTGRPTFAQVAFTGSYNNLTDVPSLSSYATMSYVSSAVAGIVNSAPAALDTLNELANAIANDASFSTTISSSLGNRLRVDINTQNLNPTQLSNARTNLGLATVASSGSYTDLTNKPTIPTLVQSDWNQVDTAQPDYIKNKPSLVTNLNSLTDVVITAATNGQVLKFDGTNWVNGTDNAGTNGSTYDQDLNTTNDVQFSSVSTSNISAPSGLEITTPNGSENSIDIYTDWSGQGVEVWLQHNDRVSIKTENGTYAWDFDNTGNLVLPQADMTASPSPILSGIVFSDGTFQNTAATSSGTTDTGNIIFDGDNIGSTNDIVNIIGNNYAELQSHDNYIWVEETYAAIQVDGYQWTFHDNAVLELANGANISQTTDESGHKTFNITPQEVSDFEVVTIDGNIRLQTANASGGGDNNIWTFDKDGNLTLPGGGILGDTFKDGGLTLQSPAFQYVELGSYDGNTYAWIADKGYYEGEESSFIIATAYAGADHRWKFNATGLVALPGGTEMGEIEGTNTFGFYRSSDNTEYLFEAGSTYWSLNGATGKLSLPGDLSLAGGLATLSTENDGGDTRISTPGNLIVNNSFGDWSFGVDGKLKLPSGGDIVDSTGTSVLGGSGGNPFNQTLNTGDDVRFANIQINNLRQGWNNFTKTSGYQYIDPGQTTDIWVADSAEVTSAKFTVQFETKTNDPYYSSFDTMTCEIVMAKKRDNNNWTDAPITVYGIVHTSENPLATFSSYINSDGKAVLTCDPHPSITARSYLKVQSVEMQSPSIQNDWC